MPPCGSELERTCAPAENLPKFSLAYCSAAVRFSCAGSSWDQAHSFRTCSLPRPHLTQERQEAQPVQLPLHAAAGASLGGAAKCLAVVARPVQRRLHVMRAQRSDYRVHLRKRCLLGQWAQQKPLYVWYAAQAQRRARAFSSSGTNAPVSEQYSSATSKRPSRYRWRAMTWHAQPSGRVSGPPRRRRRQARHAPAAACFRRRAAPTRRAQRRT